MWEERELGASEEGGTEQGRAPVTQWVALKRSATIWVPSHTRNPYFVILWASLLFDGRY